MAKRKTYKEKLHNTKDLPKVVSIDDRMAKTWGTGTMVIPTPLEVDAIMRKVPKGKLVTINQIREAVARKHKATIGCPITTGIFASIAAHAADEDEAQGKKRITPYWRTLKAGGVINPRYPGGEEGQKKRLEAEGHQVIVKGKKVVVLGYEKRLVKLDAATP